MATLRVPDLGRSARSPGCPSDSAGCHESRTRFRTTRTRNICKNNFVILVNFVVEFVVDEVVKPLL